MVRKENPGGWSRSSVFLLFVLILLATTSSALARIKLITLPVRERVEVQLDHPGVTLVEEERVVPLIAGINQVDFSWANTEIDPESIVFRVTESPAAVSVLSVSYPPNEKALIWQVSSAASGPARIRISYILGRLEKTFHYRAIASEKEDTLTLSQYLRLRNLSNEELGASEIWAGVGPRFHKFVGVAETREMLVERRPKVPIKKTYTCNPATFGYSDRPQNKLLVPMHYVLTNKTTHGLGLARLPAGKVRIFQSDGAGTTVFLGEDWGTFTPVDDQMKLYLGVARDIVVTRKIVENETVRRVGNLIDQKVVIEYTIENFKTSAVTLDVRETLRNVRDEARGRSQHEPDWDILPETSLGRPDDTVSNQEELVFHVDLPAKDARSEARKIVKTLHLIFRNEW